MTVRDTVSITSGRDTIIFGRGGYLLSHLDVGAAKLAGDRTAGRSVTFSGYILPDGGTADVRAAEMDVLSRRLRRIVTNRGGFTLRVGERSIDLTAKQAPVFAHEAPLNGDEAAHFTVCAEAKNAAAAYFSAPVETASERGWTGKLVFPFHMDEGTVFALSTGEGEITVENPGDVPCGFVLTVLAEWSDLTSFTVTAESGEKISVVYPLPIGASMVIDTRPARKTVTVGDTSAIGGLTVDSVMFGLEPGENKLTWQSEGDGTASVSVAITPLYH